MKKLLLTLFMLCAWGQPAFAFDACAPDAAEAYTNIEERYTQGLLFRIEKCGVPTSYIFGTMHVDMKDVTKDAQPAFAAESTAKTALFEIVADDKAKAASQMAMLLPAENEAGLIGMIGQEYFDKLVQAFAKQPQLTAAQINRLTPWAASIMLQLPDDEAAGIVLDEQLQQFAAANNIPLHGIETPMEQFDIFLKLPQEHQIAMLKDTLDGMATVEQLNAQLVAAYRARNLNEIERLGDVSFTEIEDQKLEHYLRQRLLTDRNQLMSKRIKPYLDKGGAFVAVGALHLPGTDGMLSLLEQQGFYISAE